MSRLASVPPTQFAFELSFPDVSPTAICLAVSAHSTGPAASVAATKDAKARAKQAGKLRALGQDLIARADSSSAAPRLSNTRRRAAMASSAEHAAAENRALGQTMVNLADAIESGEAKHLSAISSKAAVESLMKELSACETYARQAKRNLDEAAIADLARIHGPRWGLSGSSWERVVAITEGMNGANELHTQISGAEDITPKALDLMLSLLGKEKTEYELGWYNVSRLSHISRLKRAGIETDEQLKTALQEFFVFKAARKSECPIRAAMRKLVGRIVGIDFFPTPASVCARMVEIACIRPGLRVLEPSAGCGNIADAAKAAGADVDVIEISDELRSILALKGHNLIATDFDDFEAQEPFVDVVLMNPPFGKRSDARHIRKAFSMVKPGGVVVAIASEGLFFGSDAEALSFRHWLDEVGGVSERLPDNTFMDASLPVRTGVSTRLVTIYKADD